MPWVSVPHLASHILSIIIRRIQVDWQNKYGHGLLLLETRLVVWPLPILGTVALFLSLRWGSLSSYDKHLVIVLGGIGLVPVKSVINRYYQNEALQDI